MAIPMNALRKKSSPIAWHIGEPGYSKSDVNIPAESMKIPNSVASRRYSGQCSHNARIMFLIGRTAFKNITHHQFDSLAF
jgi:hypothetical protein